MGIHGGIGGGGLWKLFCSTKGLRIPREVTMSALQCGGVGVNSDSTVRYIPMGTLQYHIEATCPHPLCGRCRQSHNRYPLSLPPPPGGQGELVDQRRELTVLRPEVVSPLADAMGFIDRQETDPSGGVEPSESIGESERALRADVDQEVPPLHRIGFYRAIGLRRAEKTSRNSWPKTIEGSAGSIVIERAVEGKGPRCCIAAH